MAKNLVVVESPAKAKTIERYLGHDYQVLASYGHVRDLPAKKLGVDVKHDFAPEYIEVAKAELANKLKKAAKEADMVYLATDLDREGEAIAWHVKELLHLTDKKTKRVTFNQITKEAIAKAFSQPRQLDQHLIDAQTARRVLDRLVGYKLSPLLWKKIRRGLSAGRVQSVAVRLVVDREEEINKFNSDEYWFLEAALDKPGSPPTFRARLYAEKGKKLDQLAVKNEIQAKQIESAVKAGNWQVAAVNQKPGKRTPAAPFTTSTLQMEAARRLSYSAKRTMTIAQHLYEAGYITYMRTDSVSLASEAHAEATKVITAEYGKEYLPTAPRVYKTKTKGAQEAHEAVRPTHLDRMPGQISGLDAGEERLYELIWQRTIASQMAEAKLELTDVLVDVADYQFQVKGERIVFPGFLKLYVEGKDDEEENNSGAHGGHQATGDINQLPALAAGDKLTLAQLDVTQKFTQPPARYSEATLIKALEQHGIGRPSTYAPTLSTIQDRGYVRLEERRFHPEEIGVIVTGLLKENFPNIVDLGFTAGMEEELDDIADGKRAWVPTIAAFYTPFALQLKEKEESIQKTDYQEKTGEKCPKCNEGELIAKFGRFGKFLTCSRFPDCDYSRSYDQPLEEQGEPEDLGVCPDCGKPLVKRRSRYGEFTGCSGYPECKYIKQEEGKEKIVAGVVCPKDEGDIVEKRTRRGKIFWGCKNYPKCDFASWDDPTNMSKEQLVEAAAKQAEKLANKTAGKPTRRKSPRRTKRAA